MFSSPAHELCSNWPPYVAGSSSFPEPSSLKKPFSGEGEGFSTRAAGFLAVSLAQVRLLDASHAIDQRDIGETSGLHMADDERLLARSRCFDAQSCVLQA